MSTESQTVAEFLKSLAGDLYEYNPQYCAALAKSAEHVEQQQSRIAELERQAAIGWRAVEMLSDIDRENSRRKGLACCPSCGDWDGHHALCELAAILRDYSDINEG